MQARHRPSKDAKGNTLGSEMSMIVTILMLQMRAASKSVAVMRMDTHYASCCAMWYRPEYTQDDRPPPQGGQAKKMATTAIAMLKPPESTSNPIAAVALPPPNGSKPIRCT